MPTEPVPPKVLLVDDDPIIADSLALILRGRGFDARAAYSGEEAAEVAILWKPDAMIADVMMGQMDGVALAIYLAQALPSCRLMLMSGYTATERMLDQAKQNGHDFPILAKPFHPDRLFEFLGPLPSA